MTAFAPAGISAGRDGGLLRASATELAAVLRTGEISATELLELVLDEIERLNPLVNAIVTLDASGARQQALARDRETQRGARAGPLHGVPVTVKDAIEVSGLRTTAGSKRYADHIANRDAPAVARLRAAGAVIVGKTNVPNLAGDYQTYNSLFGLTRNPWSLERTAGGSSGGSAVSIACGFGALDLGSDTAGSLSLPAHYCGVYAHKPTYGSVPTLGHIPPSPGSQLERDITVLGPLARSPHDLALAFGLLGGRPVNVHGHESDVAGYRIAALLHHPGIALDPTVVAVLEQAVGSLCAAGLDVQARGAPDIDVDEVQAVCCQLIAAAASSSMTPDQFDFIVDVASQFEDEDRRPVALLARGTVLTHRRWLELQEWVRRYQMAWRRFFHDVDLVLCPVAPTAAFRHDVETPRESRTLVVDDREVSYFAQLAWPSVVGLAHAPATTVPAGIDASGLPVGLQVMGPPGSDERCLRAACALETVLGGYRVPPVVADTAGPRLEGRSP